MRTSFSAKTRKIERLVQRERGKHVIAGWSERGPGAVGDGDSKGVRELFAQCA